jgi:hypothetical protein
MSSLLEQAIVDAKALKNAALKNAENLVIEKYSQEIKETMTNLLEVEEPAAPDAPTGRLPEEDQYIEELPDAFETDSEDTKLIKIDLNQLEAEFDQLASDEEEAELDRMVHPDGDDEITIGIEDLEALGADTAAPAAPAEAAPAAGGMDMPADMGMGGADMGMGADAGGGGMGGMALQEGIEDLEEDDDLLEEVDIEELLEAMKVDFEPVKSGWAGTPDSVTREYENMILARENDAEVAEELETLRARVKELTQESKLVGSASLKLQNENGKLKDTVGSLHKKLEQVNVSNAKLLYINQTLENSSLNERQKRRIVEAISKADTVTEAKKLFQTLQETVVNTTGMQNRGPSSLTEAAVNRSSLLVAAGRQEQKNTEASNPVYNRLQKLAGIKTKENI